MKRPWKLGLLLGLTVFGTVLFNLLGSPQQATAANPTTMSFQGKVVNADGTNVADGTYSFLFKLYTVSSGGSAVWTETQSSVTVAGGVFQVNLGSVCPFFTSNACNSSTPIDFNASNSLYLGITFNSDPAGEMTPRPQLQSVPYAFQADNASKLGGLAASNYAQLSPGSQQTGFINVSGAGTFGGVLTVSAGGAAITGNSTIAGTLGSLTGLTSSGSITFSGLNTTGVVHNSAAGLLSTSAVALGTDTTGNYVATLGNLTGLTTSGNTGAGSTPTLSVTYGSGASTAVQGNVQVTCASGSGNLTGGGTLITLGSGGTCGAISTNPAVSFGTSVTTPLVTSSAGLGITAGTTLALSSTGANTVTLDTGGAAGITIAGTNANAVTIGNVTSNPNILFSGSGTFGTTSGAVSLNGNTTITGSKTFTVGTGLTSLGGGLSVTGDITGSGRHYVPSTTGTSGQGYFIRNSTPTPIAAFQALDNGTNSFGFFGVNKYFDGTSWQDDGQARVGSSFQIQDDSFNFYSFNTGNTFTSRFVVASGGNVGIGNNVTPGYKLDVQGGDINTSANLRTAGTIRLDNAGALSNINGYSQSSGNFLQSGTGTFGTGTGAVSLNGATTVTGTNTFSTGTGAVTLNGNVTVAANQTLTFTSGTGTITQNFTKGTSGTATTLNATNSNSTSTASTVNAASIALVGNANANLNANIVNGISFANVTALANNTFNALNVGTGFTNILQSANVTISAAGAVTAGLYNGQTISSAASFTGTVNSVTGYKFNGTAGVTVTCTGNNYLPNMVVQGGIITGNAACAGIGLSDQRVKKDIVSLDSSVLDSIKNVNPVSFFYDCSNAYFTQSNTYCDPAHQTGVIAQQLAQVFPNLVYQDSYGYYHVDYQGLSAYTLKATSEIAQHLDSAGNATLNDVTVNHLTVNNGSSIAADTGSYSAGVITPQLVSSGALIINSGSSGDVTIDSGGISAAVNIGTANASGVSISHPGATTEVKGALVVDQAADFGGNVTMHFKDSNTAFRIDNSGSTQTVAAAIQIKDSTGTGYTSLISTPNFSVAGNGDIMTAGSIISKGGSFQLLDPASQQLISFDQSGNANFKGNLNLSSAALSGGLTVAGDVNVAGLSTFQKLATFIGKTIFRQDVQFDGHITVASDTAGYATLRTSESSVHVTFKTAYETVPVVSANIVNGQFGQAGVNNVTKLGFDISLAAPAAADTTLSWTAVAVTDPQTASNPLPSSVPAAPTP